MVVPPSLAEKGGMGFGSNTNGSAGGSPPTWDSKYPARRTTIGVGAQPDYQEVRPRIERYLHRFQCLLEVFYQIVDILQTDGEAHHIIGDTTPGTLLCTHRGVRHLRRVSDE
ncbi:MAG: hypothetical protein KatS3mg023_1642 [Armatimonadota bacterium]|nr:MAG: hypothetical protein KatS3mg023_1642 [Armatimonadota bacterium]